MPNKAPFLPKIDQTASYHNYCYALSRFAYFDQKSSLFGRMAYFAGDLKFSEKKL